MPTVPTLDPTIKQTGLPNARVDGSVPVDAFGGGLAKGIATASKIANDYYLEARDNAETAQAYELDAKIKNLETSLLFDQNAGALTKQGRDALGLPDTVLPEFDKQSAEIGNSVVSPRVKSIYARIVAQRRASLNGTIQSHVAQQSRIYQESVYKGYSETAQQTAGLHYNDPARTAAELEAGEQAARMMVRSKGLAPELEDAAANEYRSKFHSSIIKSALSKNDSGVARAYFSAHSGDMTTDDATASRELVQVSTLRAQAQGTADSIMAKTGGDARAAFSMTKNLSPELRDEVERRLTHQINRNEAFQAQGVKQLADSVTDGIVTGEITSPDQIPVPLFKSLPFATQKAVLAHFEALDKGEKEKRSAETSVMLREMAVNDRKKFAGIIWADYLNVLPLEEIKSLMALQQKGVDGKGNTLDSLATNDQIVNGILWEANPDANKIDQGQKARLTEELDVFIARRREAGKPADTEEIRAEGKRLMLQGSLGNATVYGVEVPWTNRKRRVIDREPGERLRVEYGDIPQKHIRTITGLLRKDGKQVSEENIILWYEAYLNQDQDGG